MYKNDFLMLLPINVGHECQILMNANHELNQCQQQAFEFWILPWIVQQQQQQQQQQQNLAQTSTGYLFQDADQLIGRSPCCYRWALLDCLFDSLQKHCPLASTFDSRTFLMKRDEVIFYYESFHCKDYPFGTVYCYLSVWAIVGAIVLAISLALLIVVLSIYLVRVMRKQQRSRKSNNSSGSSRNQAPIQKPRRGQNVDPVTDL